MEGQVRQRFGSGSPGCYLNCFGFRSAALLDEQLELFNDGLLPRNDWKRTAESVCKNCEIQFWEWVKQHHCQLQLQDLTKGHPATLLRPNSNEHKNTKSANNKPRNVTCGAWHMASTGFDCPIQSAKGRHVQESFKSDPVPLVQIDSNGRKRVCRWWQTFQLLA